MTMEFDDEKTLDAKWVVDSETGIEYMLDVRTGAKIAMKVDGIWLNPESKPQ